MNPRHIAVKKSTMSNISDVFATNHAQTTKKSVKKSSNVWRKSWEEEDAAIITKVFSPVWRNSLVSVTEEIMKTYTDGWSRAERKEIVEFDDASINNAQEERIENKFTEWQQSVCQETYALLYLKCNPRFHKNQRGRNRGSGTQ